ncbi:MAG: hypothetical protein ACOVOR_02735 [Rhabdochlamydiaceae bacterium]
MGPKTKDIFSDMDNTVKQLIRNAELIKKLSSDCFLENESAALQKTQESLLANLINMDEGLSALQKKRLIHQRNKNEKIKKIKDEQSMLKLSLDHFSHKI